MCTFSCESNDQQRATKSGNGSRAPRTTKHADVMTVKRNLRRRVKCAFFFFFKWLLLELDRRSTSSLLRQNILKLPL